MEYRCEATSLEGCIQQLASNILPHGYWFYVAGRVPDGKNPRDVDAKLMTKYGVKLSRQQRARRKVAGFANVHYLRFGRRWVLLATHGEHRFFGEEGASIRDARKIPIRIGDYSLTVKRGDFLQKGVGDTVPQADGKMRVRVQIARERFQEMRSYFLSIASHRSAGKLAAELYTIPFEPYAPIRRQMLNILRLVNERRQMAGFEKLPTTVLRYQRRIVKPFEVPQAADPSRTVPAATSAASGRGAGDECRWGL